METSTLQTPSTPPTPSTPSTPSEQCSTVSVTNPTYYSKAIAKALCERLAESTETLAEICREPGMPSVNSVYRWRRTNAHFREQLDLARQWQAQLPGHNKTRQRFTMEIGEALCHAVAGSPAGCGISIKTFCSEPGMPHPVTVSRWLLKYPALREKYEAALACVTQKTEYSDALADKICEQIAGTSKGLHETCKALGINVHITTIFRWLKKHTYFREQYHLAKEVQADLLIEQMLHIADDSNSNAPIAFVKVQIAVRQWIAGRLNPRKWDPKMVREAANDTNTKKKPEWVTMQIAKDHNEC